MTKAAFVTSLADPDAGWRHDDKSDPGRLASGGRGVYGHSS